ncbi:LacI family DNA-binding transcriptional regulator [Microbacterium excoecariae]|uniref:LacI family DNA-binding transcriptional regulator n=1 Tax=Microbacterium excoecariae TaxID=2715210 RepID=UPI00140B72D1|nr:LacI family DNA-binding transcriptional regulator [Microbacterium excoecariae]NHI15774.1 LacI family transcriptional regulator [Microbacterium excoecariae]
MNRPTLRDVAERAGVSVSAVSYALNENSTFPLAEKTRARIRRIAREIGYVPNSLARSLKNRTARLVGVILDKPLANPRYAAIVEGLSRGAAEEGFQVVLLTSRDHGSGVDAVRGGQLDGLVFIGHDDHVVPAALAAAVAEHAIPFGAIDCGRADAVPPYTTVDLDYAAGVDLVVERLAADGVRAVTYVRPDLLSHAERVREQAMLDALTARPEMSLSVLQTGVTAERLGSFERTGDYAAYRAELGARLAAALERGSTPPAQTAFVCSWGSDVETVLATVRRRDPGYRVAGLNRGALEPAQWPGLIHAEMPLGEAGRVCAAAVVRTARDNTPAVHQMLPPALVG